MAEPYSVDLRGKIPDIGAVRFLRAEWVNPQSRFVLIRYAMGSKEEPYGLRLDLDKRAILDDVGDAATATAVRDRAQDIWKMVIDMRFPSRSDIVTEAESWIGTPFHHEGRIKGHGVDCGQLLIAVYSSLGFMPESYQLAHYSPDFALHRDREWYLEIVQEFADEIPEDKVQPGDVILFKWGRLYSHGGIISQWPEIIHAWNFSQMVGRINVLVDHRLMDKPRLFFSPRGIS